MTAAAHTIGNPIMTQLLRGNKGARWPRSEELFVGVRVRGIKSSPANVCEVAPPLLQVG